MVNEHDWDEATEVTQVERRDTIPCPPPTEPTNAAPELPNWCECEEFACRPGMCPTVRNRIAREHP